MIIKSHYNYIKSKHFFTLPAAEDSDVAVAAPSDDAAAAALLGLAPPTGVGDTANRPSDSCTDSGFNDFELNNT